MPAINFKKEFAHLVESGQKKQTIRKHRKNPIEDGQTLYLYTGLRTTECRKLKEVKCQHVSDICIDYRGVIIDGEYMPLEKWEAFANADGFKTFGDMCKFFEDHYGLPFGGVLIMWD